MYMTSIRYKSYMFAISDPWASCFFLSWSFRFKSKNDEHFLKYLIKLFDIKMYSFSLGRRLNCTCSVFLILEKSQRMFLLWVRGQITPIIQSYMNFYALTAFRRCFNCRIAIKFNAWIIIFGNFINVFIFCIEISSFFFAIYIQHIREISKGTFSGNVARMKTGNLDCDIVIRQVIRDFKND